MKALILAGGQGKRLQPITLDKPKCLVEINGKAIIEYLLDNFALLGKKVFEEIIIVGGFHEEKIRKKIGENYKGLKITYRPNYDYASTNTLHGLWAAHDKIDGAFIQCHGDIFFHKDVLKQVIASKVADAVVVSSTPSRNDEDANRAIVKDGRVIDLNKKTPFSQTAGMALGLYKFSNEGAKKYFSYVKDLAGNKGDVFETPLKMLFKNHKVGIIDVKNLPFDEIDNLEDMERVKSNLHETLGL